MKIRIASQWRDVKGDGVSCAGWSKSRQNVSTSFCRDDLNRAHGWIRRNRLEGWLAWLSILSCISIETFGLWFLPRTPLGYTVRCADILKAAVLRFTDITSSRLWREYSTVISEKSCQLWVEQVLHRTSRIARLLIHLL